jgi:FlaA1/EpsC-like NDP-sugar epimerase
MVTGAAGTIGSEICRQLLAGGAGMVVAVDINENGLYLLDKEVSRSGPSRLVIQVADIRDQARLDALVSRFAPQDLFHAAAHKHVPLMEDAPGEAIKNNVVATRHLLHIAERHRVTTFVFVSSDKAVNPTSVMGATKRVGELMTRAVAARSRMYGCAVRFGNVLGSDGSVVPIFRQQIAAGGPVTITHPDAERYFMTVAEAAGLVLKAGYGRLGDLCMLDMGEPVRILDLALEMIKNAGVPEGSVPIVFTGLRPGEKLTETLLTDEEEVTSCRKGKIQVVSAPSAPENLWLLIEKLERAAVAEDTPRVLDLLQTLLPTYTRPEVNRLPAAASF